MTKVNDKIAYLTHTWILALLYSEHSKSNSNSHKHNKMHHLHLYHLSSTVCEFKLANSLPLKWLSQRGTRSATRQLRCITMQKKKNQY